MKTVSKFLTGAAAAAAVTLTAAAPAEAQYYRHRDRGGIDAGDVIAGVAIIGGIAAIASAIGNSGNRYDRGYGYGQYGSSYNRGGERGAVDACAYEAERRNGARVSDITDVDRRDGYYRVRGVIDAGNYDYRGRGYDRGYGGYDNRASFTCTVRNGRVYDFDTNSGYRW